MSRIAPFRALSEAQVWLLALRAQYCDYRAAATGKCHDLQTDTAVIYVY